MKIAIYGREFSNTTLPFVQEVFDCLRKFDIELYIYEKFNKFISGRIYFPRKLWVFKDHHEIKGLVDVMISLGGDGTMLDTVTLIRDSGIPVIGINFGRLGFLASINKGDILPAIESLVKREYTIDSRDLLRVDTDNEIFGDENFALNDLTVHRRDNSAMMIIHAYLNGEFLNSYWADGLIVATPTGSTAYSLSCGGPIIFPQSENFVITPISPHNLNVRPVVISDAYTLSFELEGRSSKYLLSLDSRTKIIDCSLKFSVRKADFQINLVRLNNESYLSTLRNKMLWGIDTRNY
ncbi:NAD+ kinase [Arcticibacter tournemirensis]|uniref:NAD kinase n=1 Tax=Arcticibacter tournemirensis TaxID=699437 RepID=A0A4Q0M2Y3_9SPHI|nr:NAD kinase [Arcticibacter tournemirensis]KAA8475889.1 NAD kinase [Arcticibacter tournemirensis]RXF66999.1 NAD kinase [Arcticibacter tournemirensis]TQM51522.1 NAD+ kinase [Arcticibacter tournemirensis]